MAVVKDFKCPNCGGILEFDAQTQKLKCPYCEGKFDPEIFDDLSCYFLKDPADIHWLHARTLTAEEAESVESGELTESETGTSVH